MAPFGSWSGCAPARGRRVLPSASNSARGGYYGIGLLECLPTELAEGEPGYGTGITEPDVRELAAKAGFREVTRVMPEDPMLSFFVLRN